MHKYGFFFYIIYCNYSLCSSATVTINEVAKSEGEAMINNRKGKLIYFYEWVLKLEWSATLEDDPKKEVKGSIEIPNLSEENDPSEVDVSTVLWKYYLLQK